MRSYEAARSLFSFLAFCAWSVVIVGALVALIGAGGGSRYGGAGAGFLAMAPGIGIGLSGLLLVAFVQMGRATVDTAEYTQQMLKIARDQLEVSKQGLKQGAMTAQSFEALKPDAEARSEPSGYAQTDLAKVKPATLDHREIEHDGHTIVKRGSNYFVGKAQFNKLVEAKLHIVELNKEARMTSASAPTSVERAIDPQPEPIAIETKPEPKKSRPPKKKEIIEEDGKFRFGNMVFGTRERAEAYASQLGVNPNAKPNA